VNLPSEHFYIRSNELALLTPAVKRITARLTTAKHGHFPFQFPYHLTRPELRDKIYAGRKYDEDLADEFQRLQNRLAHLSGHGKLRVNVQHVTLLAFALRNNRESQAERRPAAKRLETRLESLRKRLKGATGRRLPDPYVDFSARWKAFVQWMQYNILYERKRRPRLAGEERIVRRNHTEQLRATLAWLRKLIDDCDATLSTDALKALAKRVKRRGRQRRFGEASGQPQATMREMLEDIPRFSHEVARYVERNAEVSIRWEYLDLSRTQSANRARMHPFLSVTPESGRSPALERSNTPATLDEKHGGPDSSEDSVVLRHATAADGQQGMLPVDSGGTTEIKVSSHRLVDGVCEFLQTNVKPWEQELVVMGTIRESASFVPQEHEASAQNFSLRVRQARKPDLPKAPLSGIGNDDFEWEINFLLQNLCMEIAVSEVPGIVLQAWRNVSAMVDRK
jgi:hypothetical protein